MIVNQFRVWARTAVPSNRADGASALARAYLYSNLDEAAKADAVSALTELLDDPSPLVRRAIAEAFASAAEAPHHLILALADDQSSIASIVLARSPVLSEAELIDCAATADPSAQAAIADRPDLSSAVAAAIAEIGAPEALVALARNAAVRLPEFSIRRMVERANDTADVREALLKREDLPTLIRLDLAGATARALAAFVSERNWMSDERMARVAREAKDKAAIMLADSSRALGPTELVAHLRQAGQLTVGFIFRAILSGKLEIVRASLANLSGLPFLRVDALVDHCESAGFAALYRKASLPPELLAAFRIALRAVREIDWTMTHGSGLSRAVIERVLTGCETINSGELDRLIVLLRRFEAEAARDEVRAAPACAEKVEPLALKAGGPKSPLLLTDIDDGEDRLEAIRARLAAPETVTRPQVIVDLAAIEAELIDAAPIQAAPIQAAPIQADLVDLEALEAELMAA